MADAPTISAIKDLDDIFGESSATSRAPLDASSVDLLQGGLGPSTASGATWDSVAPSAAAADATTGRLSWGDDLADFMSTGSSHAAPVAARESMWDDFLGLSQPGPTTVAPVTHDLNFSEDLREFWVHSPRAQPPATASYDFIALDSPAPSGPDPFAADATSQGILLPGTISSFPTEPEPTRYAPSVMAPSSFEIPSPVHDEPTMAAAAFVGSDSPAAANDATELSFATPIPLHDHMNRDVQDGVPHDETANIGVETCTQDGSADKDGCQSFDATTVGSGAHDDENAPPTIGDEVDGFLEVDAATHGDTNVVTTVRAPCDDNALSSTPAIGEDVSGFLDDDAETDAVLYASAADVAVVQGVAAVPPTSRTMADQDSTDEDNDDDDIVSKESTDVVSSGGTDVVDEHIQHDQAPDEVVARHDPDGAARLEPSSRDVPTDDSTDGQVPEPTSTVAVVLELEEMPPLRYDDEAIHAGLVDSFANQFSIDDDEEPGDVVNDAVVEADVVEGAGVLEEDVVEGAGVLEEEGAGVVEEGEVVVHDLATASIDTTSTYATSVEDAMSAVPTVTSVDASEPTTSIDDEASVFQTDDVGALHYNDNASNFATEDSHSVYQDLVSPVSQVVSHLDAYDDVGLSDDDGYVAFSEPSSPERVAANDVSSPAGHSVFSFMNPADNAAPEDGDDVSNVATEDSRSVYQDLVSPSSEQALNDPMMMEAPSPSASTVEFTVTSSVDDDDEETTADWTASNSDQTLSVGSPAAHHEVLDAAFAASTSASTFSYDDDDLGVEKTVTSDWAAPPASTLDTVLNAVDLDDDDDDDTTPDVVAAGATTDAGEDDTIIAEPIAPAVDEPTEVLEESPSSPVEAIVADTSSGEWVDSSAGIDANFSVAVDNDDSAAVDYDDSTTAEDATLVPNDVFTASPWQSTTATVQEEDTAVFSINDAASSAAATPWLEQVAPVNDTPSSASHSWLSASANDDAAFGTESTTTVAADNSFAEDDDVDVASNPWLQETARVPEERIEPRLSAADKDRAPPDSAPVDANPWLQSSPPPAQPTNPWLTATATNDDDDDDGFENPWATAPAAPAASPVVSNPWFTAPAAATPVFTAPAATESNPWLPSAPAVPSSAPADSSARSSPAPSDLGNTTPWTERAAVVRTVAANATSSWLSAGSAKVQQDTPVDDDFGDFVAVEKAPANEWATSTPANDGGWGVQPSAWAGNDNDNDDDFGDFGEQAEDDFASFEAPATSAGYVSGFDSFAPPAATPPVVTADALFMAAFPVPAPTTTEALSMLTTQDVLGSIDFPSVRRPVTAVPTNEATRMTRTASGSLVPAPPSSSSSGLMKKFSSKLGFSGLRTGWSKPSTKTSTLTLRRKGDKATRSLELQLESISGGFDEIKWKCALFLFDADEVASTAPSQIQVLSSSGAILSSKTDKGAVQKLFKDKASVWTIDIGASRESTEE
ncbi:hypothetical protein SPRG_22107 [Saprolegnia parasitica CBS 223.65]|uniref:Uncharacterized protein n=1 Tax=Saprolegnia parasitica (strain CBS 223.65) TaxID=695850 RepID=A0A067CU54_SAPPC|nr:hypothetical protein SPRG_22107 [Saprolegnia parasitica CBS 223.65]KDO32780.1 hypothetical protein SPRG_22107 [Saprolegnia parasitica CBS 223.65]|eukprot:XP_012196674.1 hypothetical protein SPRG_22107 [Saprolegnia parasitica CBS 223.65]